MQILILKFTNADKVSCEISLNIKSISGISNTGGTTYIDTNNGITHEFKGVRAHRIYADISKTYMKLTSEYSDVTIVELGETVYTRNTNNKMALYHS